MYMQPPMLVMSLMSLLIVSFLSSIDMPMKKVEKGVIWENQLFFIYITLTLMAAYIVNASGYSAYLKC